MACNIFNFINTETGSRKIIMEIIMEKAEIVAMAVAAIAEELGTDVKRVKVIYFKEVVQMQEEMRK